MGTWLKMTDGFGQVRTIGLLNGETLRMKREEKPHFFRSLNAWAIDKEMFDKHNEIKLFIIEEIKGDRYLAPREAFEKYGETINYAGHGEQIALELGHWEQFRED